MPEMTVTVRWPDGSVADCYSPSLVMHEHLVPGTTYRVGEFVQRAASGLGEASDRVRARYGFACTASAASLERIQLIASSFDGDDLVEVVAMRPPLPFATSEESR